MAGLMVDGDVRSLIGRRLGGISKNPMLDRALCWRLGPRKEDLMDNAGRCGSGLLGFGWMTIYRSSVIYIYMYIAGLLLKQVKDLYKSACFWQVDVLLRGHILSLIAPLFEVCK
jgi:hypothetical protein